MAPQSAQDVVQINVYGATLSDMLHKGVNIPRLLGKFGYDDCVVFDVPRRKQSSTGDLFDRSFDDSEKTLRQNNDQMKDKFYEERNGVVGNPLNSLLNCSLSTIPNGSPRIWHDMDESDEDLFFPFGEDVVFPDDDADEGDAAETANENNGGDITEEPVASVEGADANSVFANLSNSLVSFGSSVADCMIDVLARVEAANALPNGAVSDPAGVADVDGLNEPETVNENSGGNTTEEPVAQENKWCTLHSPEKLKRKRRASSVFLHRPRKAPSIPRSSTAPSQYVESQLLSPNLLLAEHSCSPFDVPILDTVHGEGIIAMATDNPPEDLHLTVPAPTPFVSSSSTEYYAQISHVGQMEDPNPFPDDFLEYSLSEAYCDVVGAFERKDCGVDRQVDANRASSVGFQEDEFFDCMTTDENDNESESIEGRNVEEEEDAKDAEHPHSPSKKSKKRRISEEQKKYNCEVCYQMIIWRPNYGRTRFRNHVLKHFERPIFKCQLCDFRADQEHKIRYHHRHSHPEVGYQKAVSCESPQDSEDLLKLWETCFPGLICPSSMHLGNIPLKRLN